MFCSIGFETLSSWICNPRELRRGFANPPNKNIYYFVAQTLTVAHSGLQIRSNVSNLSSWICNPRELRRGFVIPLIKIPLSFYSHFYQSLLASIVLSGAIKVVFGASDNLLYNRIVMYVLQFLTVEILAV